MTGDDDLRARLAGIDPVSRAGAVAPSPPPTTAEIAEIAELIMHTDDRPSRTLERTASTGRLRWLLAAAVVAAAAVGVGGVVATGDKESGPQPSATLALSGAPGDAMTSCAVFDVAVLRSMPVAFAGTATSVDDTAVTLEVDRWYTGGTAEQVTISVPGGRSRVALDGVEFVDGRRYLVTATDGTVNGCGMSGPRTPELEAAFAEAFGR